MTLEKNIKTVNWPEKSGEHKIVQLDVNGKLFLRFPNEDMIIDALEDPSTPDSHMGFLMGGVGHAGILWSTLKSLEKGYSMKTGAQGYEIPNPQGKDYNVLGMGKAKIDIENKSASFYGKSLDYEIGINSNHLDKIKKSEADWKIKYSGENSNE
jgi:hypothetical protein|tara:strand:+ start:3663 stop:4124 length:462 start_codon:yes stop_codon:yes gene_type:complete